MQANSSKIVSAGMSALLCILIFSSQLMSIEIASAAFDEQVIKNASDGASADFFGINTTISGDITIVGAGGDDDVDTNAGAGYKINCC